MNALTPFAFATQAAEPRPAAEAEACLTFEIAGQVFAVAVSRVREILDTQPIAVLPNAPTELLGMIDVRGRGVAVVDIHARLGFRRADEETGRILVFEIGERRAPVAALADRVIAVVEIGAADIEPAPASLTCWSPDALRGVTRIDGKIVMILRLDALFQGQDDFGRLGG